MPTRGQAIRRGRARDHGAIDLRGSVVELSQLAIERRLSCARIAALWMRLEHSALVVAHGLLEREPITDVDPSLTGVHAAPINSEA